MAQRIAIAETLKRVGEQVRLSGWITSRRDHGKLIFLDLRDHSGMIQLVATPDAKDAYVVAEKLRPEWIVTIEGTIRKRPENMVNTESPTGTIELSVDQLVILAEAKTPPFPLDTDGYEIEEELRLAYRYLDLRRERLQKNIRARHEITRFIRNYLSSTGFLEIETPILTRNTPEGAREFMVPARLHPGKFYVLPQSPQQFKQLLMAAGFERYFQIARCFRDEDTRGDRQPEFTQLDLEMSFVEREDVMAVNEALAIALIENLYPQKKIQEIPFPRLSYQEAMERYGTDRPDLRADSNDPNLLAFCWITDFPFFEKTEDGSWTFTHNPFSSPKHEHTSDLLAGKHIPDILTSQYDIVLNGFEIGGGSIRSHDPDVLTAVFRVMGLSEAEIERNFGHMLRAFSFGVPPHGGIAWGLDRLVAILQGEPNIREVIAFPKTGDARDLMMGAPSEANHKQLTELGIAVKEIGKE